MLEDRDVLLLQIVRSGMELLKTAGERSASEYGRAVYELIHELPNLVCRYNFRVHEYHALTCLEEFKAKQGRPPWNANEGSYNRMMGMWSQLKELMDSKYADDVPVVPKDEHWT